MCPLRWIRLTRSFASSKTLPAVSTATKQFPSFFIVCKIVSEKEEDLEQQWYWEVCKISQLSKVILPSLKWQTGPRFHNWIHGVLSRVWIKSKYSKIRCGFIFWCNYSNWGIKKTKVLLCSTENITHLWNFLQWQHKPKRQSQHNFRAA